MVQVVQPTLEEIIARAEKEEGAPSDGGDADFKDDPLCVVDLAAVLSGALQQFATQSTEQFQQAVSYLTPGQRAVLQRIGGSSAAAGS